MNFSMGNNEKKITSTEIERWRYPRFFTSDIGDRAVILGDDVKHIKNVLRMKKGDLAVLSDGAGTDYLGRLSYISEEIHLQILESRTNETDPNVKIRLYQCVPKSDKMEFIVQKATELGVSEIVPVISARCISRPDIKSSEKKIARYQKIALEAVKQCGGSEIPKIFPFISFEQIFMNNKGDFMGIIFYEQEGQTINNILKSCNPKKINIIIGSEGGFKSNEVNLAKSNGYFIGTLGKRILRCETAPIAALSILMNLTGNM